MRNICVGGCLFLRDRLIVLLKLLKIIMIYCYSALKLREGPRIETALILEFLWLVFIL